eukprot:Skav219386  [mRNA]  locus=scaffold2568:147360:152120:- [translate_table: standard]
MYGALELSREDGVGMEKPWFWPICWEKGKGPEGMLGNTEGEAAKLRQALAALQEYEAWHGRHGASSQQRRLPAPSGTLLQDLRGSSDAMVSRVPPNGHSQPEPALHHGFVGMLLTSVLRGMLGDGLTSGLHMEALDLLQPRPALTGLQGRWLQEVPEPHSGELRAERLRLALGAEAALRDLPPVVSQRPPAALRETSLGGVVSRWWWWSGPLWW